MVTKAKKPRNSVDVGFHEPKPDRLPVAVIRMLAYQRLRASAPRRRKPEGN